VRPAAVVANLEDAIAWTLDARYDDATLEQSLLFSLAFQALVEARSCILRALGTERPRAATMNGGGR